MTTTEPFLPDPDDGERGVPAADPGAGAPEPAEGTGPAAEEPDRAEGSPDDAAGHASADTPFRTPEVPDPE